MAMLRAKQIKLNAAGDILIGGVNGQGSVLAANGAVGTVLKTTAAGVIGYGLLDATEVTFGPEGSKVALSATIGGLDSKIVDAEGLIADVIAGAGLAADGSIAFTGTNYLNASTTLKGATIALDTQIKTVADAVATLSSTGVGALQTEIDAVETALGLAADGTLVAFGGTYTTGATSFKGAIDAVDTGLNTLKNTVDGLVGLSALNFAGEVSGAATETPAGASRGDVYRIITIGATDFAGTGLEVNVGDFVAFAGTQGAPGEETPVWVKFDNTDAGVSLVGGETSLTVSGNAHSGFVLGLNKANVTGTGAITVTGGTNAALSAVSISLDAAAIGINDLSGTLGVAKGGTGLTTLGSAGQFLRVTADGLGLEYADVDLDIMELKDEDGVVVASAETGLLRAAQPVGIAETPALAYVTAGAISEYINEEIEASETATEEKISNAVNAARTEMRVDEFTVGVDNQNGNVIAGANVVLQLSETPFGAVVVYFNGIKLASAGYTVNYAGNTVTLVDSANGYVAEVGDVLSVSFLTAMAAI